MNEIESRSDQERIIEKKRSNSEYWRKAAENVIDTGTPAAAIVLGYFAAEAKFEQLLAQEGYKTDSHGAVSALTGIFDDRKLENKIRSAYDRRKQVNYTADLHKTQEAPKSFLEDIDEIIEELQSKLSE